MGGSRGGVTVGRRFGRGGGPARRQVGGMGGGSLAEETEVKVVLVLVRERARVLLALLGVEGECEEFMSRSFC